MNYSSLIDRYLEGKLSGKKLAEFELELSKNPALAEAVQKLKSLHDSISKYGPELSITNEKVSELDQNILDDIDQSDEAFSADNDLEDRHEENDRAFLQKVLSDNRTINKTKNVLIHRGWLVAASLAALISVGAIFVCLKGQYDPNVTFEKYYEKPSFDPYTRSSQSQRKVIVNPEGASIDDLYYNARIHYTNADYRKAVDLLSYIPENLSINEKCHLISGISYMELGKYSQAVIELSEINGDILLLDTAKWYLGLSHLKNNELSKALDQFQYLATRDHQFGYSSIKISRKLSRYIERKQPLFE